MKERLSLVFTEGSRLSTLRMGFESLWKNSRFKDHEVVLVADHIDDPVEDLYLDRTGQNGRTVREWLEKGGWHDKLNLKVFDDYEFGSRMHLVDAPESMKMHMQRAFEGWNYGVTKASHDWVCMSDTDCYFAPDWDYNLMKHFDGYIPMKYVFVPVYGFPVVGKSWDQWLDDHKGHAGWAQIYMVGEENMNRHLTERGVLEVYEKRKLDKVVLEHASHRREVWHNCVVYWRGVLDAIAKTSMGGGVYDDCFPRMPDVRLDDYLWKKLGIIKVGVLDSFVFHLKRFRENPNISWGFKFIGD